MFACDACDACVLVYIYQKKFKKTIFSLELMLPVLIFDWRYELSRKLYIRRNNKKVDSVETGHIVIAHLLPWSDRENRL